MSERRRRGPGARRRATRRVPPLALLLAGSGLLAPPASAQDAAAPSAAAAPTDPTDGALVDPYYLQTREVQESAAEISQRVPEVEVLRGEAERLSQATRLACIDEKLARIRRSVEASDVIRKSWPNARTRADFAGRTVERMRLLKLYAISAADEAHRCTDVRTDTSNFVRIEGIIRDAARPIDAVRPPVFERPPLASPY